MTDTDKKLVIPQNRASAFMLYYGKYAAMALPIIRQLLKEGEEYLNAEQDIDKIVEEISAGRRQFWIVWEGGRPILGVLTQINIYHTGSSVCIVWMGGYRLPTKFNADAVIRTLEKFAEGHGASFIEAKCRGGVARLLKDFGFEQTAVYVKKLVGANAEVLS